MAQYLPVAGVDGSLSTGSELAAEGPPVGKDWHLNETNALSGYLTAASVRLSLSQFVNGHRPGSGRNSGEERICEAIARLSRRALVVCAGIGSNATTFADRYARSISNLLIGHSPCPCSAQETHS
jgi:hypothetical protein